MSKFRSLAIESLENRELMAGNVTVKVPSGNFLLTGDAAANSVTVTQPQPGHLLVQGTNGTTVNGKASVDVAFNGDATFNLAGGADRLTIGNAEADVNFHDNLTINGGAGIDKVAMQRVLGLSLTANLGAAKDVAADSLLMRQCNLNLNATITTGGGTDRVTLLNSQIFGTTVIDTGAGTDAVSLSNSEFTTDFLLYLRAGDDHLLLGGKLNFPGNAQLHGGPGTHDAIEYAEGVNISVTEGFTVDGFEEGDIFF
jgi:hypothetical protein